MSVYNLVTILFALIAVTSICPTIEAIETTTTDPVTTTTTATPEQSCAKHNNGSCNDCLKTSGTSCYYCFSDKSCHHYRAEVKVTDCHDGLKDAAILTCIIGGQTLAIVLGSLGGALFLAIAICCCCCCRKHKRVQLRNQMDKWERQRAERKTASDERRQERETRMDEIRRKYNIKKDGDNKYNRFE